MVLEKVNAHMQGIDKHLQKAGMPSAVYCVTHYVTPSRPYEHSMKPNITPLLQTEGCQNHVPFSNP